MFTANMHTDDPDHEGANAIVAEAKQRGVPVVSAKQMLTWLDGRDDSSFGGLSFNGNVLQFSIDQASGANGLEAMLPADGPTGALTAVRRNGAAVPPRSGRSPARTTSSSTRPTGATRRPTGTRRSRRSPRRRSPPSR